MRQYTVVISIVSADKGPDERTEVHYKVGADSIADLVAHAQSLLPSFELKAKETPKQMHERLAAKEAAALDPKKA